MQLFQREWGARKLLSQTWQSAFVELYKEMSYLSEDRRIIRRLGPIDPMSATAVSNWVRRQQATKTMRCTN